MTYGGYTLGVYFAIIYIQQRRKQMKTLQIGNTKIEMTEERKNRVREALAETERKLNKELGYSEDLQHKDTVNFYNGHIARLNEMLR